MNQTNLKVNLYSKKYLKAEKKMNTTGGFNVYMHQ